MFYCYKKQNDKITEVLYLPNRDLITEEIQQEYEITENIIEMNEQGEFVITDVISVNEDAETINELEESLGDECESYQ